ncbi:MAG TPA: hypothetical protein VG796_28380 [Verrucomicrobiales bacterium]|nr:hypothetical protein [Verrucomicrobiales bacterium]
MRLFPEINAAQTHCSTCLREEGAPTSVVQTGRDQNGDVILTVDDRQVLPNEIHFGTSSSPGINTI